MSLILHFTSERINKKLSKREIKVKRVERVGQLAIGGDDKGCSSIFVSVSTDFRCGATI